MGKKKISRRFTIQFSRTDPLHIQAANILNQYERFDKAKFVVNAILHYEQCSERYIERSGKIDEKQIEAAVSRALRESNALGANSKSGSGGNMAEKDIQPYSEISFDDAMESLGEDGLSDVADALSMFRRK